MSKISRASQAILAAATALCLSGAASGATAQQLKTLTVTKGAPWGVIEAGVVFSMALGYFKEEGVDPQFVVISGSYASLQQILSGAADGGYISPEVIPVSLQPGNTPMPMRMAYNYLRRQSFEVIVPAASPVQKLSDLKGKKIGVLALAAGSVPITKAALAADGVGTSDYTLVPVGVGPQAVQAFTSGTIDALNLWHTIHEEMREKGVGFRRIPFPPGFEIPSTGIAFSSKAIEEKPDLIAGFGRAMSKGTVACIANPEACVRSFWKMFPDQKPAGAEEAALASGVRILKVNFERIASFDGPDKRYGAYGDDDWRKLMRALKAGSLVANTEVPFDKVYTNQFADAYINANAGSDDQAIQQLEFRGNRALLRHSPHGQVSNRANVDLMVQPALDA